jgi:hypothetical protein
LGLDEIMVEMKEYGKFRWKNYKYKYKIEYIS